MGAGAAPGISEALKGASESDLAAAVGALSPEQLAKLRAAVAGKSIKIYAMPFQHNFMAIKAAAKLANVEIEFVFTDIMAGEQCKPEFLAKFPMHTLPAMEDTENGLCVGETNAILRYIAMKGKSSIYPTDFKLAAQCDMVLDHKLCSLGKTVGYELIYPTAGFSGPTTPEKETEAIAKMKKEQWPAVQKFITENGGSFVCGNEVSIADISLWGHVKVLSLMWSGCPAFTECDGFKAWFDAVEAKVTASGAITDENTGFWTSKCPQHA